ncbi:2-C-methyl-D-erythritol 4-phosphate cytidylyltransferase [Sphaerotilus mobilis]|uniref:2-C-methyl-D-erythritol 4-phosphate cytidylyltransferase n=1 Tax=Sphaerotilus mobilis TaxID=47994 RepID=A0A4Q7LSB7_9BURK|nr:2-C-methyl-D-erythritol 4-phosphate cytidylyltransferase [Sphaerotilus mobilis]RZS57177.1 2-C-methyl-D-erythritol 4-phosphate cytidylyltransferase [Sphaerotilus mobilis]
MNRTNEGSVDGRPDPAPRLYAVVPCAGTGSRAGLDGPKQYHRVAGRPVVAHTLAALAAVRRLGGVMVVLSPDDTQFESFVPSHRPDWVVRTGGASRADSVAAGLQALAARGASPEDWVLVHDAARCLIQPAWVDGLIDACLADPVGGLLALPLADTLKQAEAGRAVATVDRQGKWAAQTPQMFRLGRLADALRHAGPGVTDEASAIEARGLAPRLVAGHFCNFKVTWPGDFALAEQLLPGLVGPAGDGSTP